MPRPNARAETPTPTSESNLQTSTLVPGRLVHLKTTVKGNVTYSKEVIQREHRTRDGAEKAKWQTERTITDPEEFKKASQTRMKARMLIVNACSATSFGLLCPEAKIPELNEAIVQARAEAARFNRRARHSRIDVYVITGRIARDDVEAARTIKNEVRELIEAMRVGIRDLDVSAVRKAAGQAKQIGSMLSPEAAEKIQEAIAIARKEARKIVKAGESAAQEIDQEALRKLQEARTSFLELGTEGPELTEPTGSGRALEMGSEPEEAPEPETPAARRGSRRYRAEQEA